MPWLLIPVSGSNEVATGGPPKSPEKCGSELERKKADPISTEYQERTGKHCGNFQIIKELETLIKSSI